MRFKQLEDILSWVTQFHLDVENKYSEMKESVERERVAMLLEYLADHEHALAEATTRYKDSAQMSLLNTWFNQMPEINYKEKLNEILKSFSGSDTYEVVIIAIQCHDLLIDLYKNLQLANDTPSSKEFFQELINMEEHEKLRMVRDAGRLEDI